MPASRRSLKPDPRLPGAELLGPGLLDLAAGRLTAGALLVLVAASRLRALGFEVPPDPDPEAGAVELRLYRELAAKHGDAAYSRYNSQLRRLQSFLKTAAVTGAPR